MWYTLVWSLQRSKYLRLFFKTLFFKWCNFREYFCRYYYVFVLPTRNTFDFHFNNYYWCSIRMSRKMNFKVIKSIKKKKTNQSKKNSRKKYHHHHHDHLTGQHQWHQEVQMNRKVVEYLDHCYVVIQALEHPILIGAQQSLRIIQTIPQRQTLKTKTTKICKKTSN